MARLNIEDSIFKDNRFMKLVVARGGLEAALGALVHAWIIAQKYYLTESKAIPWEEWEARELSHDLINAGLAVREGDFVTMRGADEQFSWLRQRVEAGRRGGLKKQENSLAVAKRSPSKTKQTLPSSSSSFSYSYSNNKEFTHTSYVGEQGSPPTDLVKNLENQKPPARGKRTEAQNDRIRRFVAAYVKAYKTRFGEGARPEDLSDPKVRGQIAQFAADHPDVDRACELVQVYFQMDEKWFKQKGYDFFTFRNNLALVGQAVDSGSPTGMNWDFVFGKETKGNT